MHVDQQQCTSIVKYYIVNRAQPCVVVLCYVLLVHE